MTIDITELAQSLKEPAKQAIELGCINNYAKGRHAVLLFKSRATPEAVLSLVEALETAQQQIDELENDEVRQRLANAEHQLHMAELAKHNLKVSRKAQFRKRKAAEKRVAELESFRTAYMEWSDKTNWVRTDRRFDVVKPLGKHIADVLKAYIEHLESPTFTFEVTAEPFTCPRCGTTTTHPEGWHYCHKREGE